MEHYAGLDISLEEASVCVMDDAGSIVWRGSVACDGAPIASALEAHAPSLQRVLLETGLLSHPKIWVRSFIATNWSCIKFGDSLQNPLSLRAEAAFR